MSGRITAQRVARVQASLTGSQRLLLEHLGTAKLLSGSQLRRLTDSRSVYERRALQRDLKTLTELRVFARLARRVGGVRAGSDSYVYALDVVGQRILDPRPRRQWRRPWTPGVRVLDHTLAISDLYVRLVEADRAGQLDLLHFATEPHCWRTFAGPGGARLTLKPDAQTVIATQDHERHYWIEVDRSTESLTWITDKAKAYSRYFDTGREQQAQGVFPLCLWIAPDQQRAAGLTDALARLPADHWQLHQVTTTDAAMYALTAQQQQQQLIEGTRP